MTRKRPGQHLANHGKNSLRHSSRCAPVTSHNGFAGHLFLLFVSEVIVASTAFGNPSDFVIDPTQSYITMTGTVTYPPTGTFTEQFSGSLTTELSGNIFADTGNPAAVLFESSFSINLTNQASLAQPGGTPAQLAAQVANFPSAGLTTDVSFSNLVMGIPTSITEDIGGVLATNQISFDLGSASTANINSPGLYVGSASVSANALNTANPGSLQAAGTGERLVIPFDFVGTTLGSTLQFTGQIVAVSTSTPGAPVQWTTASGGNGHYYQDVPIPTSGMTWVQAEQAAAAMSYNGLPGHLVTITSQAENNFVTTHMPGGTINAAYLGGYQEHERSRFFGTRRRLALGHRRAMDLYELGSRPA